VSGREGLLGRTGLLVVLCESSTMEA